MQQKANAYEWNFRYLFSIHELMWHGDADYDGFVWIVEFEFYDFVFYHIAMNRNAGQQKYCLPIWMEDKYGNYDKTKITISFR